LTNQLTDTNKTNLVHLYNQKQHKHINNHARTLLAYAQKHTAWFTDFVLSS